MPLGAEDGEAETRYGAEVAAVEKATGRSSLCQLNGSLPDAAAMRAILACWTRAFDLDPATIDDEHVSLLMQGLEDTLQTAIARAAHRAPRAAGGAVRLDRSLFARLADLENYPVPHGDALLQDSGQ